MSLTISLAPIADVSASGSVSYVGFATAWQTLADESDATYTQLSSTTSAKQAVRVAPMVAGSIEGVVLSWRVANAPGTFEDEGQQTRAGVTIAGVDYASDWATQTLTVVARSKGWSLDPSTGLPWTRSGLHAARWWVEQRDNSGDPSDPSSSRFYRLRVTVTYIAASSDQARVRDRGSRALQMRRKARRSVEIVVPAHQGLAAVPLERVGVEHWAGRGPDGEPHGPRDWQRWQGVLRSIRVQPEARDGEVRWVIDDWRRHAVLLHDGGASTLTPGRDANGVPRIMRGNTLAFGRASVAYAPDPASGLVSEAQIDEELLAEGPWQLHERAGTNYLLDSSNSRGVSSVAWTVTSVTNGTTDGLFEPTVTGRFYRFTGSGHQLQQTTGAMASLVTLSLDWRCNAAAAVRWSLQRGSDSKWYRASDQTWQATEQDNSPSAYAGTYPGWVRDQWHIDMGSATTALVRIKGVAAATLDVAHAQLEAGRYATSRIVTTSAVGSRAASVRTYAWTTATRPLLAEQGGAAIAFSPHWSAADVVSTLHTLLWLEHDANNSLWWGYDPAYGLTLEVTVAGALTRAVKAWSPGRGQVYRLGARWCSSRGELGLAPWSIQVGIDGVMGDAATCAAAMTEAASGSLEFGNLAGARGLDGAWRELRIVQYVPTAGELGRGLR